MQDEIICKLSGKAVHSAVRNYLKDSETLRSVVAEAVAKCISKLDVERHVIGAMTRAFNWRDVVSDTIKAEVKAQVSQQIKSIVKISVEHKH